MISGTVVNRGPIVPLVLCDADGNEHATTAVVDAGFTGCLTLPKEVIASLALAWHDETRAVLAAGSETVCKTYYVTVIWAGRPQTILIDEVQSEPLVGMSLLLGFRFVMETVDGGMVQVERMQRFSFCNNTLRHGAH